MGVKQTLTVPAWMTYHGKTEIICYGGSGDIDGYGAQCKRHFTKSGCAFSTYEKAEEWQCPYCTKEAREYEVATRDE